MQWIKDNRKTIELYLLLLFVAFAIEIFLFNLSSVRTFRDGTGINITDRFNMSEGAVYHAENGSYTATSEEFTMYFQWINAEVKNLYIDIDFKEAVIVNSIFLTDKGNSEPYKLPEHFLLKGRGKEDSRYVMLYPYGKVITIKMVFSGMRIGESFRINQIAMNKSKPYAISAIRLAIIYGIFAFVSLFRKNSRLHQIAFRTESKKQLVIGGLIMSLFLMAAMGAYNSNIAVWKGIDSSYSVSQQYHGLTESLLRGEFSLDYPVSPELRTLKNPYDPNVREGIDYKWDTAYYNEKYYCYFGITPVLLLYLPFRLMTGGMIRNYTVSLIFSILMIVGSFYLIRQVLKRWGKENVPFFAWPLLSVLLCFSENFFFLYMRPYFYNIPIAAANALAIWGVGFWIKGTLIEKKKGLYYFMGSLCMALVAGCRPHMALISVLAVPLFWDIVIRKRRLFSKNSLKETLAICVPYIVIGGVLMYYNAVRFGSVFEFGAQYNLTTNDMTRRGFHIERLGTGVFTFLFQPPVIVSTFPYVREALISSRYMGKLIVEFVLGGIFMTNVIALLNGMIISVKDILKKYEVWTLVLTCLSLTIILSCADATIAGILQRYTADIALMALFPACVICCVLLAELWKEKKRGYGILCSFMVTAFLLMMGFDFFMIFADPGYFNLKDGNSELYYYVQTFFSNI